MQCLALQTLPYGMCSQVVNGLFTKQLTHGTLTTKQCAQMNNESEQIIFECDSYRTYFKRLLINKQKKNSKYSMRAFAQQLGVAPSMLTELFRGNRNLSAENALRLAERLKLSQSEAEYLQLLVQYESARSPELKATFLEKLKGLNPQGAIRDLSVDQFKMISIWYHLPILELCFVSNFKLTAESAAKGLGISKHEAELALSLLENLELIEKTPQEHYIRRDEELHFSSEAPNGALRKFHRQMLEKAMDSLEDQTPQEKVIGSRTFAFDSEALPEAKKLMNEYFAKLMALSDKCKKRTEVYHSGVQVFKITKLENKNE